jgi:predicted nucleotidyltransferase
VSLLVDVARALEGQGVRHALIGAAALAVHGVSRSTADVDLLTVDMRVLDEDFWAELADRRVGIRLLKGDFDDPLAGSVRLSVDAEIVDLVVGRFDWQREIVESAPRLPLGELSLPVAKPRGLILLKLHAGGPKDAWDIRALLGAVEDAPAVASEVERALPRLPQEARRLWSRLRSEG